MNSQISDRISILRTLLIFGIVILHIPPSIQIPTLETYASESLILLKLFTEKTLFRAAVPTLSVISGYLFFLKYAQRGYVKSIQQKTRSLLVPLILWNLPLVLLIFLLQAKGMGTHSFRIQIYPFQWSPFSDAILGLQNSPANFPLAFLRDLFACVLVAPLTFFMIKRSPFLGLFALIMLVVLSIPNPVILRPSIMIGFYLGGMIAYYQWDLSWVDKYAYFFLSFFLALSFYVTYLAYIQIHDPLAKGLGQWLNALRLSGVFAFWGLSSLLLRTPVGQLCLDLSSRSFFVFCSHGPLMVLSWMLFKSWGYDQTQMTYSGFFCAAPFFVMALSLGLSKLTESLWPSLYHVLTGNRRIRTQNIQSNLGVVS